MKFWASTGFFIFFSIIGAYAIPSIIQASAESQCFDCHTNAGKLIQITREIVRMRPVIKSSEIQGEG